MLPLIPILLIFAGSAVSVPKSEYTTNHITGSNASIRCAKETPNMVIFLLRDGNEPCLTDSIWCQMKGQMGSTAEFEVLNVTANHTYICKGYSDYSWTQISVHHILVYPILKILNLTISPPGPLLIGTQVVAIARFQSSGGLPFRHWKIDGVALHEVKEELSVLSENEYEIKAWLLPVLRSSVISLEVSNNFASDCKIIEIVVANHLRQPCDTTEECQALITNSHCDPKVKRCLCTNGHGIVNETYDDLCQKFPFYKVEPVKFEFPARLHCEFHSTSLTEIRWFRNGRDLCTHGSTTCSQDERTKHVEELFSYSRSVQLKNVIRNDTYTCQAITNGENVTVSETKVAVGPKSDFTTVREFGSDDTIFCNVATPNLQVRLRRNDNEFCTPDAKWCLERPGIGGSYTFFDLLKMQTNNTFTCEVYSETIELATVSIHRFIIVPKTEIMELKFFPSGPLPIGTQLVAVSRFQSSFGEPVRRWKIDGVSITNKDELRMLSQNEYESRVSLGPIYQSCIVSLEVISNYGTDTKKFKVNVSPTSNFTTVREFGSDDTIFCNVVTPNLQVRLRRDEEFCTPVATWCSERRGIGGSYMFFDILNLQANHTFTCEVYNDNMTLATVSIHRFIIVPRTEILELTFSPPGPLPNGTELFAVARFQSSFGEPVRRWKIDGVSITIKDELRMLSKNVYESRVSLGSIYDTCIVTLEVISNYGSDTKKFTVFVDATETKDNSTSEDCTPTAPPSESTPTSGTFSTSKPVSEGRLIYIQNSVFNIFLYPVKSQK